MNENSEEPVVQRRYHFKSCVKVDVRGLFEQFQLLVGGKQQGPRSSGVASPRQNGLPFKSVIFQSCIFQSCIFSAPIVSTL